MSIEPANQTPVPDPTKKEWTFLGINRADYVKILIGFLISASICLFAFWVNWRAPHLKIRVPDTIVFKGEKNQLGIVNVTISNDGSKEAEEVECWLNLAGSKIQEVKASPEYLNAVVTPKDDRIRVDVHLLNPKEDLVISALISNPAKLPEQAKVEVRGKGVIGDREANLNQPLWSRALPVALAGASTAGAAIIAYLDRRSARRRRRDDALSKIGEQLKKDLMDEPTRQKVFEYIKNYFNDLK
ncbi:MAG: hypothetical protein ABSH35_24640 [Isosphaeraceae bacterium]|jgi:hypothetical protein